MNNPILSKSIHNIKSEKKQIFSKAIKVIEPKKPKKPKEEKEEDIESLTLDELKIDK